MRTGSMVRNTPPTASITPTVPAALTARIAPPIVMVRGCLFTVMTMAEVGPFTEEDNKPSVGWNNRVCENCGRPYTQPPPWSSLPNPEEHPLWPEWILTSYCNKGLCNGVQPRGECKPRLVKTEQIESKK